MTFVDMMLSKHGVCSIEFLQRQSKEVNGEKRFKQDALRAVIDQNCRYINETLVCRGSLNNPSVDKVGLFVFVFKLRIVSLLSSDCTSIVPRCFDWTICSRHLEKAPKIRDSGSCAEGHR